VIGWHSPDGGVNGVYKEMIEKLVKEYPLIGTASFSFLFNVGIILRKWEAL